MQPETNHAAPPDRGLPPDDDARDLHPIVAKDRTGESVRGDGRARVAAAIASRRVLA